MKKIILPLIASAVLTSNMALAGCTEPTDVQLPDGATAAMPEMVKAQKGVKKYVAKANEFLACMDKEQKALGDAVTPETSALFTERYNAVVDKMTNIAQAFNAQIKAYKIAAKS